MSEMIEDFSESYHEAVERYVAAVSNRGWTTHVVSHAAHDHFLTHFSYLGSASPHRLLLLTSGIHGVEGFLGSAIQLSLIERLLDRFDTTTEHAVLLVHAINPFGFERIRRVNEDNIDLNRNFLFGEQTFQGAHAHYRTLDPFLNPKQWPRHEPPMQVQAAWQIFKHGLPTLQQAIAEGQYEFPYGLFFGGHEYSSTVKILNEHLLPKLRLADDVLHFDLHTGLGQFATFKLLLDHDLKENEANTMTSLFGNQISLPQEGVGYQARGGFNHWIRHHIPHACSFCFEVGTYSPLKILSALRAENAAYHWGDRDSPKFKEVKRRLKEMFCPQSPTWRQAVLKQAHDLLRHVLENWLLK